MSVPFTPDNVHAEDFAEVQHSVAHSVLHAVNAACDRIAPSWPLDRLIAVNPWWGYRDLPIHKAGAQLAALGGARLTMPRAWFRDRFTRQQFRETHIARALAEFGMPIDVSRVLDALSSDTESRRPKCELMTDVVDATEAGARRTRWTEFVLEQIGQYCGAWFGDGQATWRAARDHGLYELFLDMSSQHLGVRLRMGLRGFRETVATLPRDPHRCIAAAFEELGIAESQQTAYATALLFSVSGWASAMAFSRFDARLHSGDDDQIVHLLATRMAWELILYRAHCARDAEVAARWIAAQSRWASLPNVVLDEQTIDWVLQRATEIAYQEPLATQLAGIVVPAGTPSVQAVFCIDVRSEVIRRSLEQVAPEVHTLGFAGFFGLPLAYEASERARRPQLPGLLKPTLCARDAGPSADVVAVNRSDRATISNQWRRFTTSASSGFLAVEATGLAAAATLLKRTVFPNSGHLDPLRRELAQAPSPLSLQLLTNDDAPQPLSTSARAKLAASVLRAMSLTRRFARLVAFIGHGATTTNNPQAAGLACGACGGQSGELNARVLATLLNDVDVRRALATDGISIPDSTHFVPGLHDTVTDDVVLFDRDLVPHTHHAEVAALERALAVAGQRTRAERAPRLGLGAIANDATALHAALRRRAADWSEVRPEWALARNACFVIAPRERTRALNLDGRAFLHEYRWDEDPSYSVLEGILTAPMVVTNWINLQYHASTVDPDLFGSGDKVLHNVIGGNVGVFEGAGGDLRIGLARQSVHDGRDWMHEPLRLSVFIEAPVGMIDIIIDKHAVVRQLVENGWLHLFSIDPIRGRIKQRAAGVWQEFIRLEL